MTYPFAALVAATGIRMHVMHTCELCVGQGQRGDRYDRDRHHLDSICWTNARLAEFLGTSERQVARFRAVGLSEWYADRAAIAFDLHPAIVWPDWDPINQPSKEQAA